ncbi:MAG: phosphocholine cytidylyltransferase family protein [Thermodesulfobacteriota bacterium]
MSLTAIILAAGIGRRFGEASLDQPKALLEVGDESLIERLIAQLGRCGVARIVVVVGYRAELMEQRLGALPGVTLLRNPEFERGAIVSLWTAREQLAGDVLVMDADVWLPDAMLERLVRSEHASCFLLDGRSHASGEEQMLMVQGERVVDIARKPRGAYDLLGESVGFLKLAAPASAVLRELLEARIGRGDKDLEHEEVYPELLRRVEVGFERVDDLDWTEIDFPEDLERARAIARRPSA